MSTPPASPAPVTSGVSGRPERDHLIAIHDSVVGHLRRRRSSPSRAEAEALLTLGEAIVRCTTGEVPLGNVRDVLRAALRDAAERVRVGR